jgi:hypothetical protein
MTRPMCIIADKERELKVDRRFRMSIIVPLMAFLLISAVGLRGQGLNSGSSGSDGALSLTTPGEVIFDPVALGIDPDQDNVFHFTTITIGPGVIVRMPTGTLRRAPLVWLATGIVQIDGTIDLNGEAGAPTASIVRQAALPGPGGYPGGVGSAGLTPGSVASFQQGLGPGGAGTVFLGGGSWAGGGAGHALPAFGQVYGNAVLVPLRGGSGGGGGGLVSSSGGVAGANGGAGGGAIRIFSSVSIRVNGTITANGGKGGDSIDTTANIGGGGSGGAIHLIAPIITGSGNLLASGGASGATTSGATQSLSVGSVGRIRIDAFDQMFAGSSNPGASQGIPYNVPLPTGYPTLRVTSIGGIAVSPTSSGDVATPDANINSAGPVPVQIEARNIPLGTVVQVRVMSGTIPDFVVDSAPLAGTLALSTATAQVTFPPGFSRGFVRATWNPPSP